MAMQITGAIPIPYGTYRMNRVYGIALKPKWKLRLLNHFSNIFKDLGNSLISHQLKIIKQFPYFFSSEEVVASEVNYDEIEKVINGFSKDKIPGPNGWPMDFFIDFFEL